MSKRRVMSGSIRKTSGGLSKKDIIKKKGRFISRRKSALGKQNPWAQATKKARSQLRIPRGVFVPMRKKGGLPIQRELYATTRKIYEN